MADEINSTGRVYGAQFTATTAGKYRITFDSPGVLFGTDSSASIDINVAAGAGGGRRPR